MYTGYPGRSSALTHVSTVPSNFALQKVSIEQGLNQVSSREIAYELPELAEIDWLFRENDLLDVRGYSVEDVVEGEVDIYLHYLLIGQFDSRRACAPAWALKQQSNRLPWREWRQAKREPRLVSIVTPIFNQPQLTERCIRTLFSTEVKARFEVVCVDNGSDVPTQNKLRELERTYGGLRVVRNAEHLNFSLGCNIGFGRCRGEHIVFLNNDSEVTNGWLGHLVKRLSVGERALC